MTCPRNSSSGKLSRTPQAQESVNTETYKPVLRDPRITQQGDRRGTIGRSGMHTWQQGDNMIMFSFQRETRHFDRFA